MKPRLRKRKATASFYEAEVTEKKKKKSTRLVFMKLRFERKKATAMILKLKFAVKKERLDFEAEGETLHNVAIRNNTWK